MARWTLGSPVFLIWMAGFACLAAAAIHPSMADLGVRSPTPHQSLGQTRRVFVAVAVLVLPAVVTVRLAQESRRISA
jgi:hypothetical protein